MKPHPEEIPLPGVPGGASGRIGSGGEAAASSPIARVVVENPLPHLDRAFDYLVPASMDAEAVPGCRVRVRFAGKLVGGFLLERVESSDHEGTLMWLDRVVSPEPVLTPGIAGLARAVADRYAGTLPDVLRLAVPPRHARVEAEPVVPADRPTASVESAGDGTAGTAGSTDDVPRRVGPVSGAASVGEGAGAAGERSGVDEAAGETGAAIRDEDRRGADDERSGGDEVAGAVGPVGGTAGVGVADVGRGDVGGRRSGGDDVAGAVVPVRGGAGVGVADVGRGDVGGRRSGGDDVAGAVVPVSGGAGVPVADVGLGDAAGQRVGAVAAERSGPVGKGVWERLAREWADYPAGAYFLAAIADGRAPRAVWSAAPGVGGQGPGWVRCVAAAVRVAVEAGRGALVVVPDGKDVALVHGALGEVPHVALTADLGPAERYRRWLRVLRGGVRAVVGTRAAMFAPVRDLGLAVIWDDGDDLHAEPRAPYPHAREVLMLRAHREGAALLIGGYARTAEAARLVAGGWARAIVPDRTAVRAAAPRVRPAGDDAELARDEAARAARLPSVAWRALRQGLESGPVLVQVPRRGYLPALACQTCRVPARCAHSPALQGPASSEEPAFSHGLGSTQGLGLTQGLGSPQGLGSSNRPVTGAPACGGPLALRGGHAMPYCRWCGRVAGNWRCPSCGGLRVRALVVGARRTAEELGRAFPSVPVKTSGRDGVLATVGSGAALVVATPGAEPVPEGGYAAAVLLDGWALLGRPDLRAAEEALRRWMNAAALLRPGAELVVTADGALAPVQALLRWDPVTFSDRELAERAELGFPPAVRVATLTGVPAAVREMAATLALPPGAQILGPVPLDRPRSTGPSGPSGSADPGGDDRPRERLMVRVPQRQGTELSRAVKAACGVRSARKAPDLVQVRVDPLDLV